MTKLQGNYSNFNKYVRC